jgi:hypothetical protein
MSGELAVLALLACYVLLIPENGQMHNPMPQGAKRLRPHPGAKPPGRKLQGSGR